MENVGWIKLHRSINDWGWKKDPNVTVLWVHLLLTANYEDGFFLGHIIKQGSLATGLISLAEKTGLSIQQVRTALNKLKSTNEITIKPNTKFSIISIVKWDEYQEDNRQNNKPITNQQQTNNKPITTIKESKNKRSKEDSTLPIQEKTFKVSGGELVNFDELFERLWDIYPSVERGKGVKKDAKNHLKMKIVAGVDYEIIGRGIARYKKYCEAINERNKDMFRWIRDDLFNEEYTIPQNANGEKNGKLSQNSVARVPRSKPVTAEQFAALCNPDLS